MSGSHDQDGCGVYVTGYSYGDTTTLAGPGPHSGLPATQPGTTRKRSDQTLARPSSFRDDTAPLPQE